MRGLQNKDKMHQMLKVIYLLCLTTINYSYEIDSHHHNKPFASNIQPQSLPSSYTLQASYQTTYQPSYITFSPDQNWMIYNTFITNLTNIIFLRHRNNLTPQYQVKLGNSSIPIQRISSFAFSDSGDLLFIGTWSNYLFVCNFSNAKKSVMKNEDCFQSYFLGERSAVDTVRANSASKLVVSGDDNLWIFNFTISGDLKLQTYMKLPNVAYTSAIWHPKAQTDKLIIYGRNTTYTKGFISIYNISSKATNTLNTSGVYQIKILNDGQTLLATQYYLSYTMRLAQYYIFSTEIREVGTVMKQGLHIIQVSKTSDVVVGWMLKRNQPVVYQVVKPTVDTNPITLDEIFSIAGSFEMYCYAFSTDANQMLLPILNSTQILRYSLCLDNTYFNNMQCLKCSSICESCHISPDNCLEKSTNKRQKPLITEV